MGWEGPVGRPFLVHRWQKTLVQKFWVPTMVTRRWWNYLEAGMMKILSLLGKMSGTEKLIRHHQCSIKFPGWCCSEGSGTSWNFWGYWTHRENIVSGELNNTFLWYQPNRKGGTIPVGVHGTWVPSGKTLTWPDMVEDVGPLILYACNASNNMGTVLRGRHDEDITYP